MRTDAARAFAIATAGPAARAVQAAVRLGVPDALADGPLSPAQVAEACGADADAMARLLRALAAAGVARRRPLGAYGPTPVSQALRPGAEGSVARAVETRAGGYWSDLAEAVRTGRPSFDAEHECGFFEYLSLHPAQAARFDAGMQRASRSQTEAFLKAYDLSAFRRAVDIGGGTGTLLAEALRQYPDLRGVLFEAPHAARRADACRQPNIAARCEVREGDFHVQVPQGGDLYVLKAILHDWPDAAAVALLERCRGALGPGPAGRVVVVEQVLPAAGRTGPALYTDLDVMALTGGRERTRREFRSLFRAAGMAVRAVPTASGFWVLEGRPL